MAVAKSVEAYLAACPKDQRAALEKLRATIKSAIPEPVEAIAYGMPVVKESGRAIVGYAAFRNHLSLFPMSLGVVAKYKNELKPYLSGKSTIRFTPDKPLPSTLVKKIVKERLKENAARKAGKSTKT
ncbi:MAG: iron chaperone [Actinomycetota bacterium]